MISIYEFMDYRRFLEVKFAELKQQNAHFSYRYFNRLAGVKSSGFLKLVMDGKRNLAADGIGMITRGFKLDEAERKYFECLVHFNQAKRHEDRDRYFRELCQNKQFIASKSITAAQYRLFSHWYYAAILELVRIDSSTKKDEKWLQRKIKPRVGLREIKKAVKELESLSLLAWNHEGNMMRRDSMITTTDEVQSISVANFHIQMSKLAAKSISEEDAQGREFSALTIAVSEQGFHRAKKEIQAFRKRLHSIMEQSDEGPKDRVAHVNLQLFRLSQ